MAALGCATALEKTTEWEDNAGAQEVAKILYQTPLMLADLSWLVHAAERLFFALFEETGGVMLPPSLLRVIREVFHLMQERFPRHPIKEVLKVNLSSNFTQNCECCHSFR